jgi:hypothetical protein
MKEYNETSADGKWNHFMDQVHIGYTMWQDPKQNTMPKVSRIDLPKPASMGIAVEGSDSVWPGASGDPQLRLLGSQYIDIFNRGQEPFDYSDLAVVLEKIVVDLGGLKPSYLGPPESAYTLLIESD